MIPMKHIRWVILLLEGLEVSVVRSVVGGSLLLVFRVKVEVGTDAGGVESEPFAGDVTPFGATGPLVIVIQGAAFDDGVGLVTGGGPPGKRGGSLPTGEAAELHDLDGAPLGGGTPGGGDDAAGVGAKAIKEGAAPPLVLPRAVGPIVHGLQGRVGYRGEAGLGGPRCHEGLHGGMHPRRAGVPHAHYVHQGRRGLGKEQVRRKLRALHHALRELRVEPERKAGLVVPREARGEEERRAGHGVQPEGERGDHPEVGPRTAQCPEEPGVRAALRHRPLRASLGVTSRLLEPLPGAGKRDHLRLLVRQRRGGGRDAAAHVHEVRAVGQHDVRSNDLVHREAKRAAEEADAAKQGQAGDARRGDEPAGGG
mmetsp:Transcript_15953/g.45151  ORF Transcript_15953/g.45151 Transcript_15953/m.45151 type:complete len:367 (+) Transcript_15953:162-1262(+)